jgi:hypothetical protein
VIDKTAANWPASIAATGFALAAYPVAVERGFMSRAAAVERTLTTLRFFWDSPQGPEPDATGYQGFYYHFLDMRSGRRAWQCELSTIDSAFLLAGALTAGVYFDADNSDEQEIRTIADRLYRRADWQWAQNRGATLTHGWKPESGFLEFRWAGYDEAMLLYILGMGSPTQPLPKTCYTAWISTYRGSTVTDMSTFTPGRCSRTSSHIYGLIFAASRMRSCASKVSTISKTAVARRMSNNNLRWTTRTSSPAIAAIAGESPLATAPAPRGSRWTASSATFSTTSDEGCRMGPTTEPSRRGQ